MDTFKHRYDELSRRDRQILDAVIAAGVATAREIHAALDFDVSYSTVRTFLGRLEQHGLIQHRLDGKTYYYQAAPQAKNRVAAGLKSRLLKLAGSPARAAAAFLAEDPADISQSDIAYLRNVLDQIEENLGHDGKCTDPADRDGRDHGNDDGDRLSGDHHISET